MVRLNHAVYGVVIWELSQERSWWGLFSSRAAADALFWREMVENQIAYHWEYLSEFQTSKLYLINWRRRIAPLMDDGIAKRRKHYQRMQADTWPDAP